MPDPGHPAVRRRRAVAAVPALGSDAARSAGAGGDVHVWDFPASWNGFLEQLWGASVLASQERLVLRGLGVHVEPLYWAATAPLIFVVRSSVVRWGLGFVLLALPILSVASSFVPTGPCVGFLILTAVLWVIGWAASARTAAITSAVAMLGVTATFIVGGQLATRGIEAIAAADFHNDRIIDHVLSPGAMNPLCWTVLLLETNGDRYVVRRGMVSVAPALIPASRCPAMSGNLATTAPLAAVGSPDSAAIHWLGEFAMSKAELAQVVAGNCNAAALMQFARAPFVTTQPRWVIGDLRFPGGRGGGMADIDLKPPSPRPVPSNAAVDTTQSRIIALASGRSGRTAKLSHAF